jgi:hypothetical protein
MTRIPQARRRQRLLKITNNIKPGHCEERSVAAIQGDWRGSGLLRLRLAKTVLLVAVWAQVRRRDRHCEERNDAAIQRVGVALDCFAYGSQ